MTNKDIYSTDTIDKLEKIVINKTLPKVIGVRYMAIKYLFNDAFESFDTELTPGQKRRIGTLLVDRISNYLKEEYNYEYVRIKRKFNQLGDVDVMVELYEIDESKRSLFGSGYFEKIHNFITKYDVINGTSKVAKSYQQYME